MTGDSVEERVPQRYFQALSNTNMAAVQTCEVRTLASFSVSFLKFRVRTDL
jgi:hypothetical protein